MASKSIYKGKIGSATDTAEASRYNVQNDDSPQSSNKESENVPESQEKISGNSSGVNGSVSRDENEVNGAVKAAVAQLEYENAQLLLKGENTTSEKWRKLRLKQPKLPILTI